MPRRSCLGAMSAFAFSSPGIAAPNAADAHHVLWNAGTCAAAAEGGLVRMLS